VFLVLLKSTEVPTKVRKYYSRSETRL